MENNLYSYDSQTKMNKNVHSTKREKIRYFNKYNIDILILI